MTVLFACPSVPKTAICGSLRVFEVTHAQSFRRKKDHGRAEALLLAAWALGVRYSTKRGMHVMEGTAEGLPVEERAEGRPVEERAEGLTDESDAREEQRDDACKDLAC